VTCVIYCPFSYYKGYRDIFTFFQDTNKYIFIEFLGLFAGHSKKCPADCQHCKNSKKPKDSAMHAQSAALSHWPEKHEYGAPAADVPTVPNAPEKIRELNDNFRRDIFNDALGTIIISAGVAALSDSDRFALIREIQCFEDWDGARPAHDSGTLNFHGEKYIFTIKPHTATRRTITIVRVDENCA
jgi:hypothetical protein